MAAPVTLTGTGGVALVEGDEVTGSAVRDIILQNALAKVTYEAKTPDEQRGAHTLYISDGNGGWQDTMEFNMGDGGYFCISVGVIADRVRVFQATDDIVTLACQWDAFDLSSFPGGGVSVISDVTGSATGARYTSVRLTKLVTMVRGKPGYFVGWHSTPRISPPDTKLPTPWGNLNGWAEREFRNGDGAACAWSSNTAVDPVRYPAWQSDPRWVAAGLSAVANKLWRAGILDPGYSPYTDAAWVSVQPNRAQAAGPYYVADIHYSFPVARIMAFPEPFEVIYNLVGVHGGALLHFANEAHTDADIPRAHQAFIGAMLYVPDRSSAHANEPSSGVQATLHALALSLEWPYDGTPTLTISGGMSDATLDDIITAISERIVALVPTCEAERYTLFNERDDFRTWAQAHKQSCVRAVSVAALEHVAPPSVSGTDRAWIETELEVVIAYPTDQRFGSGTDLRRVIGADLAQLDGEVGGDGYQARSPGVAVGTIQTIGQSRESGDGVTFGVLRLRAGFYRTRSSS
jgi:hypothetical protein